jgi:hypothetical protein
MNKENQNQPKRLPRWSYAIVALTLTTGIALYLREPRTNQLPTKQSAVKAVVQVTPTIAAQSKSIVKADGAAERYDIAGMLYGTKLVLTHEKMEAVAQRIEKLKAEREILEARLATREVVNGKQVLIEIPTYKQEGSAMHQEFLDSLDECLSAQEKKEFLADCEPAIGADNSYFGSYAQKILIDATENGYRLVHSYYGESGTNMASSGGLVGYNYVNQIAYLEPLLPPKSN